MAGSWVFALCLVGCGDDDGGGGGDASDASCAIGATLSGDVEDSISVSDNAACLVSFSFDSGIDAGLTTLSAAYSIQIGIDGITEGQTGAGFPTQIGVTMDSGPRYSTSATGCSATVTEHDLIETRTSELGEEREYGVVGTASCTEPAVREDGAAGQITLSDVAFHIPVTWSD